MTEYAHAPDQQADPGSDGGQRVLGPWSAMSLVAGSMLGIGIFLTPSIVATHVHSAGLFFGLWVVAGLAAIAGAVAYAELGTMMPKAGGDYVFLRRAYGSSTAFASGWVVFGAVFTGSIAAMAVPLLTYQVPALLKPIGMGFDPAAVVLGPITTAQALAVLLVIAVTALNALGARLGALLQNLTTVLPVAVFAVGAVVAVLTAEPPPQPDIEVSALTPAGLAAAYMAVYFAYSGWNAVIYVAGEVARRERNIPLGLVGGTLGIMVLYLVMCGAFMAVLGYDGLRQAGEAGTAAAYALGGPMLGWAMTFLIAFGLLGTLNGTVLAGARVAYAMAHGGALWKAFGQLSPRTQVPARALWIQCVIACAFVLSGTFEQLLNLVSLAMLAIGALTVGAVFVLRRREPQAPRPYLATGYPWLPAFYLLASVLVVGVMVTEAATNPSWKTGFPLLGLGLLVAAWLVHRLLPAPQG